MFASNPFATLPETITPAMMQGYIVLMVLLVMGGTILDMLHKKSAKYFFENARKALKSAKRSLSGGEKFGLAVSVLTHEILTAGEFSNVRRRISHLFMMYGFVLFVLSTALLAGCATIVGEKTQIVPINSNPSEASITIIDEKGSQIFTGSTPTTVTLPKHDGSYWGKKSFTVTISKPGFETQTIPITAHANGWYLAGNLVFGGLIGWFIVDPLNGGMYTLSPEQIRSDLSAKAAHNNTATDGSISIVLIEDVPPSLRDKMKRIN